MTLDEQLELAEKLREVVKDYLSPHLCTGTGKDLRERKQEMARLMAGVSSAVLYDGLPPGERAFKSEELEAKFVKVADDIGHQAWAVSPIKPPE